MSEQTILSILKKSDYHSFHHYINNHKYCLDSYAKIQYPIKCENTFSHLFVKQLQLIYETDDLSFIKICKTFGTCLNNTEQTLCSLQNIILIVFRKYIHSQESRYLQFIEACFTYIPLFNQILITSLFYTILFQPSFPLRTMIEVQFTKPVLALFFQFIDIHKPIDTSLYSKQLSRILNIDEDKLYRYTINLVFLLYHINSFIELVYLQKLGFVLQHPSYDLNWEWEYIQSIDIEQQVYNIMYTSNFNSRHTYTNSNLSEIIQLKHYLYNDFNQDSDPYNIDVFEQLLNNVDLDVRLDHNVSPFLLCRNVESATIMSKHKVNRDNVNGLFYMYLHQDSSLISFMISTGIDPVPSIIKLQFLIKHTKDNLLSLQFQHKLQLLQTTYKMSKKPLFNELNSVTNICPDICNLITDYL
jgi:hypothetical protein